MRRLVTWRGLAALALALSLLGGVLTFAPAWVRASSPLTVTTTDDGPSAATTPGTLRYAFIQAQDGDTILFQLPNRSTITLASTLRTGKAVTLQGPGAPELTIRRAPTNTTAFRLLQFDGPGAVSVRGVSLSGGAASDDSGGGILANGAVTLTSTTLSDNAAEYAGGALCAFGTATVLDSVLDGNTAAVGGGLYAAHGATVIDSTFAHNSARNEGGSIFADRVVLSGSTVSDSTASTSGGGLVGVTALLVSTSTISSNTAPTGGGLYAVGTATVTNSTLGDNRAMSDGGGLYAANGATVTNSTFSGNTAGTGDGGGLAVSRGATVTNSTFSGNSAGNSGGGLYANTDVTVVNSLFAAGANGTNCGVVQPFTDGGGVISSDPTCVANTTGGSVASADPGLDPLGLRDNGGPTPTIATAATSAARGHGVAAACPVTDQRGVPRPTGASCDSGAVQTVTGPLRAPTLTALRPAVMPIAASGSPDSTLTLDGSGFAEGFATATLNGVPLITADVSPTRLTALVPATLRSVAGRYPVSVSSTAVGGGTTAPLLVTVTNPLPTLAGTTPTTVTVGAPDTALTLSGADFAVGALVRFGDVVLTPETTTASTTSLNVTIPAALLRVPRIVTIAVVNPGPGGGTSAPQSLTVMPSPSPAPSSSPSPRPSPGGATFADVPTDYWAYDQIERFYARGSTTGCGTDAAGQRVYCPERTVTRAEMAVFLERTLGQAAPPTPTTPTFADVPPDYWAYAFIEQFARLGITTGCGTNDQGQRLYCPDRNVTRAEMAVFIDRAKNDTNPTAPATATFADVPTGYWAYAFIAQFYQLGVTTGCGTDAQGHPVYCPDRNVTRAEMAVFVDRAYP
jgi:predicted outer membrane repeat protein